VTAIETVLDRPEHRTRDMGGNASTIACGDAVVAAL
jgi:isocitrate/isopropylmalate dehydrogenase